MTGAGRYAGLIADRFRLAKRRLGYSEARVELHCDQFARPSAQCALF